MEKQFIELCRCGKLEDAKQIVNENPEGNFDFSLAFHLACESGNLEVANWLWLRFMKNKEIHDDSLRFTFRETCLKGHLEVAKWLYQIANPEMEIDTIISAEDNWLFRRACGNGHLELAQWLYQIKPTMDISAKNEFAFCEACWNGHLEVAQWLLIKKPNINISINNYEVFTNACWGGYLDIARWLNTIKQPYQYFEGFSNACKNGHLEVAKWLYSVNIEIDIKSRENEEPFREACRGGHLEVAKWLYKMKPEIDVSSLDEFAFREACRHGHLEVVQWLQSLFPEKYSFQIENGRINYQIKKAKQHTITMEKEQIVTCPICDENLSDVQTGCKHLFCEDCITTWLDKSNTCPYCREEIEYNKLCKIVIEC